MKKILLSSACLLILSIFLSSCSRVADVSIVKRHYRSGYYVSTGEGKRTDPNIQIKKETAIKPAIVNRLPENKPAELTSGSSAFQVTNKTLHTNYFRKSFTPSAIKIHPNLITTPYVPAKTITKPMLHDRLLLSEIKSNNGNHSLVWTIIVILLVLFLISLLTGGWGLGGLIYLLLVIALILLILRLLGII